MPRSANVCPRNRVRYNLFAQILLRQRQVELALDALPDLLCAERIALDGGGRLHPFDQIQRLHLSGRAGRQGSRSDLPAQGYRLSE